MKKQLGADPLDSLWGAVHQISNSLSGAVNQPFIDIGEGMANFQNSIVQCNMFWNDMWRR